MARKMAMLPQNSEGTVNERNLKPFKPGQSGNPDGRPKGHKNGDPREKLTPKRRPKRRVSMMTCPILASSYHKLSQLTATRCGSGGQRS